MDANSTVKLVSGILAVVLVGIIFLRRKKKKGAAEDEF
jgi:LPXTG-motif cell wall-anchored protein